MTRHQTEITSAINHFSIRNTIDDLIKFKTFQTEEEQIEYLVNSIKQDIEEKIIDAQIDEVIVKPFESHKLFETIKRLVDK